MNYKAWVGFGFYGGTSATQRANFYSSWGLMPDLPEQQPESGFAHVWSLIVGVFNPCRRTGRGDRTAPAWEGIPG